MAWSNLDLLVFETLIGPEADCVSVEWRRSSTMYASNAIHFIDDRDMAICMLRHLKKYGYPRTQIAKSSSLCHQAQAAPVALLRRRRWRTTFRN
mgnify:CR=1 FL=1